jgi:hypothetical protein
MNKEERRKERIRVIFSSAFALVMLQFGVLPALITLVISLHLIGKDLKI